MIEVNKSSYGILVNIFFVFISFMMTTTLMNIFIAVLSEHYCQVSDDASGFFCRARAEIAFDHQILKSGLRRLFCRKRCQFHRNDGSSMGRLSNDGLLPDASVDSSEFTKTA